jgi:hypothetical protein
MFASKATPPLGISTDKVCFFIAKAREFAAKDIVTEPDPGSNPTDDNMIAVLEDHRNDPTLQELRSFIQDLSDEEQVDLVALMWLGRGDGGIENWSELRLEAGRARNERTAEYLLGTPLVSDYVEEALSLFGRSCGQFD